MQIREIYNINHRVGDIAGNSILRQYIDLRSKTEKSLPVKYKKKESFFSDLQNIAKKLPGPGKYVINPEDKKLSKIVYKKIDFSSQIKKPTKTFIDELITKKKLIPGVGKYELQVDKTEKIKKWHSILGDRDRKRAPLFKQSIFDHVPVDNIGVGPGTYNTMKPLGNASKFHIAPEFSKTDTASESKIKKSQSLPKLPTPQTYRPIPSEYETFEKLLSQKKGGQKRTKVDKQKRFIDEKAKSPGPKYNLIAEWSPKDRSKSQSFVNIFKSTRSMIPPSVYH